MSATLIRTCPLCGLRFDNLPILELHIREDHRRRAAPARARTTAARPDAGGPARQAGDGRPARVAAACADLVPGSGVPGQRRMMPRGERMASPASWPMSGNAGNRPPGIGYRPPRQRVTRSFSGSPARDESAAARGAGRRSRC